MDANAAHKRIPNPRQNASILSILTFFFTFPLFLQGCKKELDANDLYETLKEHRSSRMGDKLEAAWNLEQEKAKKSNSKPNLGKALLRAFGLEYLVFGVVLAFNEIVVKLIQPICLGLLISYYSSNEGTTELEAYLYAMGVIGCSLVGVIIHHPYSIAMFHIGMKLRVACCSLIYRKTIKLSKTALDQTTVGQLVNLLSNDVNRFDYSAIYLHYLWVAPLQTMIALYFMHSQVGISAVIGVVSLMLYVPLQLFLGKLSSMYRLQIARKTDERVRLVNEIISGIHVIKMYTWEKPLAKLVSLSRRAEIKLIRTTSYIRALYTSLSMFATRTALYVTILAFVFLDNNINAPQVYMLTCFYNVLRLSITMCFYQGILTLAELIVSIGRINKFLLLDETQLSGTKTNITDGDFDGKEKSEVPTLNVVTIKNGTLKRLESSKDNTLTNLHLNIKRGSLVAIVGHTGSGKTSLLYAILQELPLTKGTLHVNGKISYASQDSWIFAASARQNILFGLEMNRVRYSTVVKICALEQDFKLLPYGDKTLVGDRGVILSGGQKARINLARAIYKEADVYLLDDPLSAVDTHVGKQLFENCIKGHLYGKTVILVTHQLQCLKYVDHIIILEHGLLKAEGTFADLQKSGLDLAEFLKSEPETTVAEDIENLPLSRCTSVKRKKSIVSTGSVDTKGDPRQVEEQRSSGYVSAHVYRSYINACANYYVIFILLLVLILTQTGASLADYFIGYWMNLEQEILEVENSQTLQNRDNAFTGSVVNNTELQDISRNPTAAPYNNDELGFWDFSTETSVYIYSGLTAAVIILALTRSIIFFAISLRASVRLHDTLINSLTHATMRFFNTNAPGRILNRCSKDMGAIDERLPVTLLECMQIGFTLIGIFVIIITVNPWLLIPSVIIGVIFYFLRIFYLRTALNLKRLEGVTRSPVFTHISASLQGLTTIRAFGAQAVLEKEFDNHQDLHSSAWFPFTSISVAFGYWLDIICVIYITMVVMSFLIIGEEHYGGNVGLVISQSLALTGMLQWGVRQTTEVENSMTSVERVLEYTEIEQEPSLDSSPDKKPAETWPESGEIKFINLFLCYFPEDPPVLKNLNFTINPLEKVGIVGRTGAGKSSLISALFRFAELEGSIIIDGIDIKDIGLHDLRSKIAIIPQEPLLLSGTLRKNLDPFEECVDEVLWKALEEVELKQAINDMVTAILSNNKILVLDEATANVDPQTDVLIQQTIRKRFANCTVLTIAHRLQTVMDSDKVLVMDTGAVVEFDHPHLLLQNSNGVLYGMLQQTGEAMVDILKKVAEDSYKHLQMKKEN